MSAADRMVVRTRDGSYRSFPRRTALGLISRGQATAAAAAVPQAAPPAEVDPLGPHGDEYVIHTEIGAHAEVVLTDEPIEVDLYRFEGTEVFQPDTPDEPLEGQIDLSRYVPTTYVAELPPEPRGNASRADWAAYAASLGVEVSDGMTRNQIRDAAQDVAQSLDRLPQPALTGGRLETPEDEPAAERLADDEDPGTE